MQRILYVLFEVATAGIFLVPCFLLLDRFRFRNPKRTAVYLILALYISAVWVLVGMPNACYLRFDLSLQLIPFLPMLSDLKNTVLNVALFVPLGFLLPVLWKKYRNTAKALTFCFGVSLFIEVSQIFTYRATDVNDLIANSFGGFLGFLLGRIFVKAASAAPLGKRKDLVPVFAVTLTVLFFLYPLLAEKLWLLLF